MLVSERIQKEAKGRMLRKLLHANEDTTSRAELLALAIEHFCTTKPPDEENLHLLFKTESYINYVKDSVTTSRKKLAENKAKNPFQNPMR